MSEMEGRAHPTWHRLEACATNLFLNGNGAQCAPYMAGPLRKEMAGSARPFFNIFLISWSIVSALLEISFSLSYSSGIRQ
jgi:hypothetical protein